MPTSQQLGEQYDVAIIDTFRTLLAGYVWDLENPFVRNHGRKLSQLVRIIEATEDVES